MSLLSGGQDGRKTRAVGDRLYNVGWVGSITDSEIQDAKEGDIDRATGLPKCAFCRLPKPLDASGTCDDYCKRNQEGNVPTGRPYPFDKAQRGREWLSLG